MKTKKAMKKQTKTNKKSTKKGAVKKVFQKNRIWVITIAQILFFLNFFAY